MDLRNILVCLSLLVILPEPTGADVHLDISTAEIKVSCTDELTITCSVTGDTRNSIKYLISMLISFKSSSNETIYTDVANIVKFGTQEILHGFYNATVKGNLSDPSVAFLTVEWKNPSEHLAGEYRCIVTGLDEVGHSVTFTDDASITFTDIYSIHADKIKEIEGQVEDKWATIKNELMAENDRWTARFQELQSVLFAKDVFYNNHHYFLSRHEYNSIDVALALCRLYSGYLVEIDDRDEYNIIVSFLNGVDVFDSVFISGTDVVKEGIWVYQSSNISMPFKLWGPSAPNEDAQQNCIVLWKDEAWKMYDEPCYNSKYKVGVICEKSMVV